MPRVELLSEMQRGDHKVMLTEHVPSEMFASEGDADQLVQRWAGRGAVNAPPRHMMRAAKAFTSERDTDTGPTITAVLQRGPLADRRIDVDVVEGRPPKTIDVRADDGSTCRYCLADWAQIGPSAIYTFLYLV